MLILLDTEFTSFLHAVLMLLAIGICAAVRVGESVCGGELRRGADDFRVDR